MDSKRYFQINTYFAFAFMVFAVLSSVSEDYSAVYAASTKDGRSAYFLSINHLLMQSSSKITARILGDFNAFNEYIQGILVKLSAGNMTLSLAAGILFFAAIYINNKIEQNNIWRKAVF